MSKNLERLPIKDLKIDKGTQPRVTLDQGVIAEYTEDITDALKDGGTQDAIPWVVKEKLPVVFRDEVGHCYLADGFHRYFAHKGAKLKEIDVEIKAGTLRDAILYSVSANSEHGVRRTNKDKRRAVLTLLNDKEWTIWSDNEIAKNARVSPFLVASLRPAATSPTTRKAKRKGKVVEVKTGRIGSKGGKTSDAKKDDQKSGPANLADTVVAKAIHKISNAVGGERGGAVRKAIESGALKVSKKDLTEWTATSEARIRRAEPLITELGFSPIKAFAFLDREVDASSKVEELINHALARGGQFELKLNGYLISVVDDKKYSVIISHK